VTFIPKPRKENYTETKAYHNISLLSFILKTMEKLVDRHSRDEILGIMSPTPIAICPPTRGRPMQLH